MGKSPNGYDGKGKKICAALMLRLMAGRSIQIQEFAREQQISTRTVWRWLRSFREDISITVKGGVATLDAGFGFSDLEKISDLKKKSSN